MDQRCQHNSRHTDPLKISFHKQILIECIISKKCKKKNPTFKEFALFINYMSVFVLFI